MQDLPWQAPETGHCTCKRGAFGERTILLFFHSTTAVCVEEKLVPLSNVPESHNTWQDFQCSMSLKGIVHLEMKFVSSLFLILYAPFFIYLEHYRRCFLIVFTQVFLPTGSLKLIENLIAQNLMLDIV